MPACCGLCYFLKSHTGTNINEYSIWGLYRHVMQQIDRQISISDPKHRLETSSLSHVDRYWQISSYGCVEHVSYLPIRGWQPLTVGATFSNDKACNDSTSARICLISHGWRSAASGFHLEHRIVSTNVVDEKLTLRTSLH